MQLKGIEHILRTGWLMAADFRKKWPDEVPVEVNRDREQERKYSFHVPKIINDFSGACQT
jgi:hypothetical protein